MGAVFIDKKKREGAREETKRVPAKKPRQHAFCYSALGFLRATSAQLVRRPMVGGHVEPWGAGWVGLCRHFGCTFGLEKEFSRQLG